ncbi:MAG TPA: hypothetical protein VN032_03410 [Thermoanaerobaculia bacterium]|jgi:hypothetical protein|nr:hypothetical protein [Thermoanaerobaculia bacterium]
MPGSFAIDQTRSAVLTRGWGTLTGRDLLAHARTLAADPRFHPHFCQLVDLREVTTVDASSAIIRELAEVSPFGAGARRAIVVSTDVAYGMARMFQILRTTPDEIFVFRDMDAALLWLGMAESKAELLSILKHAPPIPSA